MKLLNLLLEGVLQRVNFIETFTVLRRPFKSYENNTNRSRKKCNARAASKRKTAFFFLRLAVLKP